MTPINHQKVQDWVSQHRAPCACGEKQFSVGDELVYLSNRSLALPVVPLVCQSCARVQLLSAGAIGVEA